MPRLENGKLHCKELVSVAQFTLIIATNEPHRLLPALQSRLLRLEFDPYDAAEIKEIAEQRAKERSFTLTAQAANYLAGLMAAPTPRTVDQLLNELQRYLPESKELGIEEVRHFLHVHLELNTCGLGPTHRRYLARSARVNRAAARCGDWPSCSA